MLKVIQIIGLIGFFICLFLMYMTKIGVNGIRKYDPAFNLPDMKFHYSVEQITQTLDSIGEGGRELFQKYLFLDYAFTICFLIVMLTITKLLFAKSVICNLLIVVCLLRALFDILENSLLLTVLSDYPAVNKQIVSVSSCFTSFKFSMLYIWILAIVIQGIILGIHKIKGG